MILCAYCFAFFTILSIIDRSELSDFYFYISVFVSGIYFYMVMVQIKTDCGL